MKKILLLSIFITTINVNASDKDDKNQTFLQTYANIALQNYTDALIDAKKMLTVIESFSSNPNEDNLALARQSWLNARESYGQTEIFRLSNGPIDAEEGWVFETYGALEGRLNAWPLDENMIDYTIDESGTKTKGNIIDTIGNFTPSGEGAAEVNVSKITPEAISALNENGSDANVASGYHAIEFLLWGQDQDYTNFMKDSITNGPLAAGDRPITDFTTDKFAKRRLDYLVASAKLIINDLTVLVDAWEKDNDTNYRAALLAYNVDKNKNIPQQEALKQIFSGMGVFIKSELANERIAVAALTPSEEDEHSCFSDNTHRDITLNYQGFKNILFGIYNSINYGEGAITSLEDNIKLLALLEETDSLVDNMNAVAEKSYHFDYQIRSDNAEVKNIIKMKNNMRKLGDEVINIAKSFDLELNVADVTDTEETRI